MPPDATDDRSRIQVLERAGAVLALLGRRGGGRRLAEVVEESGLAKTTVHRIVAALAAERLVRIDPNGRIWLGPAITTLAATATEDLAAQLRPTAVALADTVDEIVDVSVLDGDRVRFIDQVSRPGDLRVVSGVDVRFPLHCTANGKALLAALPVERAGQLVGHHLPPSTPNTCTDREALFAELGEVRRSGVARDLEEHTTGIVAVGAAVITPAGPVAALSVPLPAERRSDLDRIGPALRNAADHAGHELAG